MTAGSDSGIGAGLQRANSTVGHWADVVGRVRHAALSSWERRALLGTLVALAAALLAARHALGHAVRLLHPAGQAGFSVDSLHAGGDVAALALGTWSRAGDELSSFLAANGRAGVLAHGAVELALGPVLGVLAAMGVSWLREQADRASRREGGELFAGYATALTWSLIGLGPLVVLWSLEQLLELRLVGDSDTGVPGIVAELAGLAADVR
ncbi:MAG: hypothetical protein GEV08_21925, partial [Acidimicrobiia bacterium]|nr:hypothetical protein [Acidimicrobiia bacterium]